MTHNPVANALARFAFMALLAVAAAAAPLVCNAGTGLMQLPATAQDGPVVVFYPSATPDAPVQRGPYLLQFAQDAPPARGNGRLVVISHGSGGNAWSNSDLARTLVQAGFVVAVPEHREDNARDPARPGPDSWKQRPAEVSRAIDTVGRHPVLAGLLSLDRVGMYGMSAGGHTALTLAGGRWSPAQVRRHCEAHIGEDFHSCVGLATQLQGDALDGLKKTVALGAIRWKFDDERWYAHQDPRVRAVVAGVPYAADFDFASLATPAVPLALVTAAHDAWLVPRFHSDRVLAACRPRCELLAHIADGAHGALLSPPPPMDRLGAIAARLLGDPPGFDRAQVAAINARIAGFFQRNLLP
ncbi:MAG TPA: dienelactone hydrolase [Ramlibacter sp.]|nr:dienelactone hydrolase [Ramlibacter sp.]